MTPAAAEAPNPLDQLKDIHLPEQIDHFQLALGWWVLIALAIGLMIYLFNRWNKKRKALRMLIPANNELNLIAQRCGSNGGDNIAMAELSALLKRICLLYYPKQQVAALSGDKWTDFLNQQSGEVLFNSEHQAVFSRLTYQANQQVEATLWSDIIEKSQTAINNIIRQAAVKQLKQKNNKGSL